MNLLRSQHAQHLLQQAAHHLLLGRWVNHHSGLSAQRLHSMPSMPEGRHRRLRCLCLTDGPGAGSIQHTDLPQALVGRLAGRQQLGSKDVACGRGMELKTS